MRPQGDHSKPRPGAAQVAGRVPVPRRNQRVPPAALIAELEESVRRGVLSAAAAEPVIEQLRSVRPDEQEANGGRREHILRVASRVFAEKGYRATSLQEIADEVGVTRPSFYYHFKSKQEILAAIVDAAFERAEAAVDEATETGGSAIDQIRDFVRRYVEINTEHAEVPVLFQSLGELDEEAAEAARRRRRVIDHKLARLIERGVQVGELTSSSPLIAAYGILGAANWMHTWYRQGGRLRPEEIADMLADLALYGLARRPRTRSA
jgi:TetR/AcrR family transcriptional regulator, cholesterol catabolism regulator